MAETSGYILRIASEEWVDQVFSMAVYYTSVRRNWKSGQTILFVHKTGEGDAFVGYGVIGSVKERATLSAEEENLCEKHDWKKAIEFTYVMKFGKPLPVKSTFLKDLKLGGRCLHGFPLTKEQQNVVIDQAERLQQEK